ncbi:MAG: aminotransferase class IV [Rickettsiaceae bacterium H1]|nr:aminotransferase class IV [Rickettsiaceae bacterium H1]
MTKYYYINNKLATKPEISCYDRGFRFGDGVFETISVFNSVPYLFDYHIERLMAGLKALKITAKIESIKKNVLNLIEINKHKQGLVRIITSRGISSTGYLPHDNIKPTIVITTANFSTAPGNNISLCVSRWEKPSIKAIPTGVKLLQGLNSTLAKMEARDKGFFDSILLNHQEEVCEVSSGNIFWVKEKKIYTPSVNCGLVSGIIRKRIIEIFPVIIGKFKLDQILSADEVFITNVSWPILIIDTINDLKLTTPTISSTISHRIIEDRKLHCS